MGLLGFGAGVGDEARLGAHKPLVVTAVADDGADGAGKAAEDALMEFCHDGMCLIFIQLRVSTLTDILLKPYLASVCMDNATLGTIIVRTRGKNQFLQYQIIEIYDMREIINKGGQLRSPLLSV